MIAPNQARKPLLVTSVIASLTAGGIGPVCRYAAEGMSKLTEWQVTLLSLHDPVGEFTDKVSGLRIVCLGLNGNCARLFLDWLKKNPQDLIITSDVCHIEPAFRFLPPTTRHVIQIHDSGRRYRDVAVRHAPWVDGVTCVGKHIEEPLGQELHAANFSGLLRTVHNGANFPPLIPRQPYGGPLRLLFMGRVEPLKGVLDFIPLLQRLKKLGVPVRLNIVGGENDFLRRQLTRKGLSPMVTWTGRVPHEQCYAIAAESDVFLMTSRKEPFGMVTIEAMSMGCVPLAYDIPSGSTEIIEHGRSGLLVSLGDIHGWAEKIRNLHNNRKRLAELSAATIVRARADFNADVMSTNLTGFLRDVMDYAAKQPARREAGMPPEEPAFFARPAQGYQRLPASLRTWIRNWVCARPRLSYWLLNR
jgi:glycosyltransferase involved in cell wall biosynthesis